MSTEKKKDREVIDFKAFVDVFNTYGKDAALKHVAERYSVQYNTVVKRLRVESEYHFDQSRDRYYLKDRTGNTADFMTIEELSRTEAPIRPVTQEAVGIDNDAVLNLIVDRFFELNRFINFSNREQKIIINQTSAKAEGYNIEYV